MAAHSPRSSSRWPRKVSRSLSSAGTFIWLSPCLRYAMRAEAGVTMRRVKKSWRSIPTSEGAGVKLRRALGFQDDSRLLDPFLLLDDFRSENPDDYLRGFPWHPHRGMETITYVLDGEVEHGDSMGNGGLI